jgi:hypothetical protein
VLLLIEGLVVGMNGGGETTTDMAEFSSSPSSVMMSLSISLSTGRGGVVLSMQLFGKRHGVRRVASTLKGAWLPLAQLRLIRYKFASESQFAVSYQARHRRLRRLTRRRDTICQSRPDIIVLCFLFVCLFVCRVFFCKCVLINAHKYSSLRSKAEKVKRRGGVKVPEEADRRVQYRAVRGTRRHVTGRGLGGRRRSLGFVFSGCVLFRRKRFSRPLSFFGSHSQSVVSDSRTGCET